MSTGGKTPDHRFESRCCCDDVRPLTITCYQHVMWMAEGRSIQVNMDLRHQPLYNSRTHVEESRANMTPSFIIGQPVETSSEITTWEYDKAVRLLVCVCVCECVCVCVCVNA